MFGHHILKTYLRHRLTKICILRRISLVTSHVSHPYKSTDFTQALKILILVSFRIDVDSHTFLSFENDPLAFCIFKPFRHTEICNFCSIQEKNDMDLFCITLQCGKKKQRETFAFSLSHFLCCPSSARSHAMPIAQTSRKGTAGVSAMLLVTTIECVFIIILVSLRKSVPTFCRYCIRYKYL